MILFIFLTKLFLLIRPNSDEYCRSSRLSTVDGNDHPDSIRFQIGMFGKSDYENGEINFGELEPEEIKSELKRLYTQLHVYKTKSVKKDNPHIQTKRRGGKKNRRFSTQFSKAITRENDSYQVKTPDESICSNDATNLPHSIACSETGDLHNLVSLNVINNKLIFFFYSIIRTNSLESIHKQLFKKKNFLKNYFPRN